MNKKDLNEKKHDLIIIGSARGINRFYITNKFMTKFPNATVINTSNLIRKIINEFDFPNLEHISLTNFSKIIEPALTQTILAHLEHSDVVLDTTYYYILPGISAKEILKFTNKVSKVILILVSDSPTKIQNINTDKWFKDIHNIRDDLSLNKFYFELYTALFSSFTSTTTFNIDLNKINHENELKIFLGGIRNGNKKISRKSERILC